MRDKKIYCNNCNLEITKDNVFISNGIPYCKRCNQAKYALTDVIESIKNSGGKEISVTKEDDELVVQYKPYWRK